MNVKEEKFSLMKFFSGFGNIGKVLFYFTLFAIFTIGKDYLAPRMSEVTKIRKQEIETYVEAPKNKAVKFFGLKINRFGFGVIYEKNK